MQEKLRLKVWAAMHDYYWDARKLRQWYLRLLPSASPEEMAEIEEGMRKYPDLELIRIKGA